MNVTGRSAAPSRATYETENISADGLSFLRNTSHFALAVYSMLVVPDVHVAVVSAPLGGSWSGLAAASVSSVPSSLTPGTLANSRKACARERRERGRAEAQ